jgi:hypothetical protein
MNWQLLDGFNEKNFFDSGLAKFLKGKKSLFSDLLSDMDKSKEF